MCAVIVECVEEFLETKTAEYDFFFARPSFRSGVARTLDLGGQFDDYNSSESETDADAVAIAADWAVIGQDLLEAVEHETART
jgi:hypothetical protein